MRHSLALALMLAAPAAASGDVYRTVTVAELAFDAGAAPALERAFGAWELRGWPQPMVRCEGAYEAYLGVPYRAAWNDPDVPLSDFQISVRTEPGSQVHGVLLLPQRSGGGMTRHPFSVPMEGAGLEGRADFLVNRYLHFAWRYKHDLPGAAWFRHQARVTRAELDELGVEVRFDDDESLRGHRGRANEVERSYDLFTGGRALSENLALEDALEPAGVESEYVKLEEIEGVTTRAIDWEELVEDLEPELDPLAERIPHDQHALFFPSFASLVRVIDEGRSSGAPVLELLDASSEDALTMERYERQLCLPLDAAARMLGAQLVESVAITGSDPYLRTGSDLAVLLRAGSPRTLESFLIARQQLAAVDEGAREVQGTTYGFRWSGVVTDDRRISSYFVRLGDDMLVSNSLVQLERITALAAGEGTTLASLDEYVFFRDRYARGEEEDAFLVISDAAIRRWCSPRWRIGASRRTRAAALLAEQRAADLDAQLAGHRLASGVVMEAMPVPGSGALRRTDDGPRSEIYGTDRFLTPIIELDMEFVTVAERDGYNAWRRRYDRRWSRVFDPAAARLVVRGERLELDLSVIPITVQSQYRDMVDLTRGTLLPPLSGDQHAGTGLHFALALGRESRLFKDLGESFARGVAPDMTDPLGWLGDDVSIWVDDDPSLWEEVAASDDPADFLFEENFYRLPIALRVGAKNPLKMALFLTAMRTFVQGSAPNLVRFEAREYRERGYVAILPEGLRDMIDQPLEIYYLTLPDALVFSLREDVVQGVIDRDRARAQRGDDGDDDGPAAAIRPWLGESAALRVGPSALAMLDAIVGEEWAGERRRLSWRAIPILNEWRWRAPDADPIAFHAEHWGVTLRCPAGGAYVWDEEWGTYASAAYGHPGAPREGERIPAALRALRGAEFGVTFEQDGIRARVRLER